MTAVRAADPSIPSGSMSLSNNHLISCSRLSKRTGPAHCTQPMNSRSHYDQSLAIVSSAIRAWDPLGLAADGAPPDEYAQEVARIVARIPRCRSEAELAAAISEVFSESFESDSFTVANCSEPARRAWTGLVGAGLLQPA